MSEVDLNQQFFGDDTQQENLEVAVPKEAEKPEDFKDAIELLAVGEHQNNGIAISTGESESRGPEQTNTSIIKEEEETKEQVDAEPELQEETSLPAFEVPTESPIIDTSETERIDMEEVKANAKETSESIISTPVSESKPEEKQPEVSAESFFEDSSDNADEAVGENPTDEVKEETEEKSEDSKEDVVQVVEDLEDEKSLIGATIMREENLLYAQFEDTARSPYINLIQYAFKKRLVEYKMTKWLRKGVFDKIIDKIEKHWSEDEVKTLAHYLYNDVTNKETLIDGNADLLLKFALGRASTSNKVGLNKYFFSLASQHKGSMLTATSWNLIFGAVAKSWKDILPQIPSCDNDAYKLYFLHAEYNEDDKQHSLLRESYTAQTGLRVGLFGRVLDTKDTIHVFKKCKRVFVWSPIFTQRKTDRDIITYRYVLCSYSLGTEKEHMFRGIFISRYHPQESSEQATHCVFLEKMGFVGEFDVESSHEFYMNYINKDKNGQPLPSKYVLPLRKPKRVCSWAKGVDDENGRWWKYLDKPIRDANGWTIVNNESGGTNTDEVQNTEHT